MPQSGLVEPGNIDLYNRPKVRNVDGTTSTVRSMSVNIDGKEVLIPTVTDDGRIASDDEAIAIYRRTGRHLGKFDTPTNATAYASRLHDDYAAGKFDRPSNTPMPDQQQSTTDANDAALLAQIRELKAGKRKLTFAVAPDEPKADERSFASKLAGSAVKSAGQSIAGIPQALADVYHMGTGDMGARLGATMRFAEGMRGLYSTGKEALSGDPEAIGNLAGQLAFGAITKRFAPGVGRGLTRVARGPLNQMMPMQAPPVPRVLTPEVMPMPSPVEIAAKLAADDAIRQPTTRMLPPGPQRKLLGPARSIQLPESTLTSFDPQVGRMPGTAGPAGSSPLTGPRLSRLLDEPPTGTQLPPAGLDQMSGYSLGRYADPFDAEGGFYARPGTMSPTAFTSALAEAIMPITTRKPK